MGYYAVIDLEMCCVPRRIGKVAYPYSKELIQIGAVLLDESFKPVGDFMTYVHPQYGRIDPFIHGLTGISAADVAGAPDIREVLEAFLEWLPEDTVIVSWSPSDKSQIHKETTGKGLYFPRIAQLFETWIDCQKIFGEIMKSPKTYRLSEALLISDVPYSDGAHDALVDARNTALLYAKMMLEPEFTVSFYYSTEDKPVVSHSNPFDALFSKIDFAS